MKRSQHAGRARSGGFSLNVFTPDEIDDIHLATLEVLERTGRVRRRRRAARHLLRRRLPGRPRDAHGAHPAARGRRVARRLPAPPSSTAAAPPTATSSSKPGRVTFTNFDEGIKYIDPYTGEYRDPTIKDVADIARLVDAMSDIDGYESAVGATDVPTETYALHGLEAALLNTTKPVGCEAINKWEARKCIELAAHRRRRRGRAARAALPGPRRLPGEPAQAAARRHRGDHRVLAGRPARHHPLDGHVGRLGAGHPGRHAGAAQRRGARRASCWRSSPSAARR